MKFKMMMALLFTFMLSFVITGLSGLDKASAATGNEVKLLHSQYEPGQFKGSIEVENIAYHKQINIIWQIAGRTDGWKTTPASYAGPTEGNFEAWEFSAFPLGYYSASVATSVSAYGIDFYIEYYVNGIRYIDNNNGSNYHVGGYNQAEAILKKPAVKMGKVAFASTTNFKGSIYVKNLSSSKEVKVIYSSDNWATVQQSWAHYVYSFHDGLERWEFDAPVSSDVKRLQIAVMYIADTTQYWDTNINNRNYIIQR